MDTGRQVEEAAQKFGARSFYCALVACTLRKEGLSVEPALDERSLDDDNDDDDDDEKEEEKEEDAAARAAPCASAVARASASERAGSCTKAADESLKCG